MTGSEETSSPTKTMQSPKALYQDEWEINFQWENLDLVPFNATSNWGNYSKPKAATLIINSILWAFEASVIMKINFWKKKKSPFLWHCKNANNLKRKKKKRLKLNQKWTQKWRGS